MEYKSLLKTAAIVIIVIAVVWRVDAIKKVVVG